MKRVHHWWRCGAIAFLMAGLGVAISQEPLPPGDDLPERPVDFALIPPPDIRLATCTSAGVVVNFPAPLLRTECPKPAVVSCDPPSGSVFPVGTTVVTCAVATDCGERSTQTFTVTVVVDTLTPALTCPTNIITYATGPEGVAVDYPLPALSDDADDAVRLACEPPPGSLFPIGVTTVQCAATDACDRAAECSFTVEVRRAELRLRGTTVPDPTGGPDRPALHVMPVGFEGLDVATALDGDWDPLGSDPLTDPVEFASAKFYRPPTLGGVLRGPQVGQAEIAYVQVGLLAAYTNPGINPGRAVLDDSTAGGTKILSGDAGGSGANLWSGPQNLPFTFHFFGRPYKTFRVSKNGLLTFSTNVITGQEGLAYFDFQQNQTTNVLVNRLPLWNNGFAVDNTIFCMAGRHVAQTGEDSVYGYVYGAAPKREVWIVFRHSKDIYGKTTTAIVLEETSNRILLMDMDTDSPGNNSSRLVAGIQGQLNSTREVRQVAAAPAMRLVASSTSLLDNGCYLFRPYALGLQKSGQAAPSILSATNLDLFIAERIRRDNLPGVTVAISDHGRLIFNKAYGYANVEKSEIMKPHHRACIGSTSKVLATIGIEKLIGQGLIPSVNALAYTPGRLGKPWFWMGVNEGVTNNIHTTFGNATTLNVLSNITIRHLLSHTAALGTQNDDVGAANAYAGGDYTQLTPQQQVRWFMATRPLLTNGVARLRQYSNPSFKQIGVLIEEVAGQPFETWMMNHIMIPAGVPYARLMRTFENEETWRDARRYHDYKSGSPWTTSRITQQFGPRPYGDAIYANAADGAAGSWTATAADLVRLMAALDRFPNKPDILDTNRIDELDRRAFPAVHSSQGIGWDTCSPSSNWIQKNGNIGYGSSHLMRSMTNGLLTVAVVANSGADDPGGNTAATSLCRDIFNAIRPLPPVTPLYDLFPAQLQMP